MYADDANLNFCGANLAQLNDTINKDLQSLEHWLRGNKLSLNVVKAVSMNILSRQRYQRILGRIRLENS